MTQQVVIDEIRKLREQVASLEAERDKLGNELAQERAKPGGSWDQAAFAQLQEENRQLHIHAGELGGRDRLREHTIDDLSAEIDRLRQALADIASPRMLKSRDAMVDIAREALADAE